MLMARSNRRRRIGGSSRARSREMELTWARRDHRCRPAVLLLAGIRPAHQLLIGMQRGLPAAAPRRRERAFVWRSRAVGWQRDRDFAAAVWRKSLRPHWSRPRR